MNSLSHCNTRAVLQCHVGELSNPMEKTQEEPTKS
jgi:hypothetical protein